MIRPTALALLLAAGSLTAPAPAVDLSAMTEEERAAFRAEVRAYLLDNPEVIREAIEVLQARSEAAAEVADVALIEQHAEALFSDPASWQSIEATDATLTLVEFSDYRCGFCKRAHPVVARLMEEQPNLRLVIKEFPILGPDSVVAGRMAMAAHALDPGKYKALNDALMEHRGPLTEAASYRIANEVGYDIADLKAKAATPEIEDRIAANHALARDLQINGTPAFVVGNRILRGFLPYEEMLAVLEEEREAASN